MYMYYFPFAWLVQLNIQVFNLLHPVVTLRVRSHTRLEVRHALDVPVTGPTVLTTCVLVRGDTYPAKLILTLLLSFTDESGALTTVGEASFLALLLMAVVGTALAWYQLQTLYATSDCIYRPPHRVLLHLSSVVKLCALLICVNF